MSRRDVVLMLAQRLRRWPLIRPTLLQCLVFKASTLCARQTQDITRQMSVWESVMSGDPVEASGYYRLMFDIIRIHTLCLVILNSTYGLKMYA